ncbi:intrinsic membrane protein PufX [Roseinatronobacter thiooxidans]|uniref:Intrinsic membrane protein PufX n=1 Tax=Roseinatronobacter thiooxidans TaxID=121821 RepID=A0A2W7QI25_9RHOB|nr:RC-LH1 core complex protein PufX [Roseinatronobacter thiooxidans]PZX45550.1 intrinsic membrane protein PufX [Roseinatronobacter thiooxidans]
MVEHDYIQETPTARLRNWVLSEMLRGAGYAALLLLVIGVSYGVIWGIGQLLPSESKNAPPPMPYSALHAPLVTAKA